MKRLLYTFIALSFIFSSCEKEEESNNSSNNNNSNLTLTNQNIIGVWQINSLVYDNVDYTNIVGFQNAQFIMNSDNIFTQNVFFNNQLESEEGYLVYN